MEEEEVMKSKIFRMPKAVTINGRSSSITNAFISGVIPCIYPTEAEIKKALSVLGMSESSVECAYCGDRMTEWDHFKPLIIQQEATGYISEINNLVPSCGKCNQSKGNKNWKEWMLGPARLSPKTRKIKDLGTRVKRLEYYEEHVNPTHLDFEEIVGKELWDNYRSVWRNLLNEMNEAQLLSSEIKATVIKSLQNE